MQMEIQREGHAIQREGNDIQREGHAIQREGNDIQREGNAIHREGHSIQREGNAIAKMQMGVQREGNDIQREGHAIHRDSVTMQGVQIQATLFTGVAIFGGALIAARMNGFSHSYTRRSGLVKSVRDLAAGGSHRQYSVSMARIRTIGGELERDGKALTQFFEHGAKHPQNRCALWEELNGHRTVCRGYFLDLEMMDEEVKILQEEQGILTPFREKRFLKTLASKYRKNDNDRIEGRSLINTMSNAFPENE